MKVEIDWACAKERWHQDLYDSTDMATREKAESWKAKNNMEEDYRTGTITTGVE